MYSNYNNLILLLSVIIMASCANIVSPQGGEKDTRPPYAIASQPTDSTVNFNSKKIEIRFNEFIQLKDPQKNITISPPLSIPLILEVNNKTLIIKLKKLKPNTTYTIKATNAVADITEGNTINKLLYVFSTGPMIDTLKISGTIYIASTHERAKFSTVVLKKETTIDTSSQRELPDYYTIADEYGRFTIDNIQQGNYYINCFEDKNKNMAWDEGESIGFKKEPVRLIDTTILIILSQFEQEKNTKNHLIASYTTEKGIYFLEFQKNIVPNIINQIDFSNDKRATFFYKPDSSACFTKPKYILYTNLNPKDSAHFLFNVSGINYETAIKTSTKKESINIVNTPTKALEGQNYTIQFNRKIDTSISNLKRIVVFSDTENTKQLPSFKNDYCLTLKTNRPGNFRISIPKSTLTDVYGNSNDSITFNYTIIAKEQTGSLSLRQTIKSISNPVLNIRCPDISYCINFSIKDTGIIRISDLIPGKYTITVFNDINTNGKWDDGDYYKKQLPEDVLYFKESEIKTDFETEETLSNLIESQLYPLKTPSK